VSNAWNRRDAEDVARLRRKVGWASTPAVGLQADLKPSRTAKNVVHSTAGDAEVLSASSAARCGCRVMAERCWSRSGNWRTRGWPAEGTENTEQHSRNQRVSDRRSAPWGEPPGLPLFQPACDWRENQRHISRQDCRLASVDARPTGAPESSRTAKKVVESTTERTASLCALCGSAVRTLVGLRSQTSLAGRP
jgi:hypothetical protein